MSHSQKIITKCDGIITNCDSLVYYKARWTLQIATAFLLQSAARFITNCDRYYKVRWMYYKVRWLLQIATVHLVVINWRFRDTRGYKEYNAITTHTSLSQWHQLAHKIYWGSSIGFFIPIILSPNFVQSRNPDDFLFWYPTSRDTFNPKSRPDFALKSRIPRFK